MSCISLKVTELSKPISLSAVLFSPTLLVSVGEVCSVGEYGAILVSKDGLELISKDGLLLYGKNR